MPYRTFAQPKGGYQVAHDPVARKPKRGAAKLRQHDDREYYFGGFHLGLK